MFVDVGAMVQTGVGRTTMRVVRDVLMQLSASATAAVYTPELAAWILEMMML